MNNGLVFNPYIGLPNYQDILNNNIKLINKIERLEKSIRILENRINILEKIKFQLTTLMNQVTSI